MRAPCVSRASGCHDARSGRWRSAYHSGSYTQDEDELMLGNTFIDMLTEEDHLNQTIAELSAMPNKSEQLTHDTSAGNKIAPYRSPGHQDTPIKYGLIRATKADKPHKCKLPCFFASVHAIIRLKPLRKHSFYRCECGLIFEKMGWNTPFFDGWWSRGGTTAEEHWLKAGGSL